VLEDRVMMAGQSGVTGHVRLGHGAIVGAKSAVTMPELRDSLARLDARLRALEGRLAPGDDG
jgi:hypothetical protein